MQKGNAVSLREPYLRIIGFEIDADGRGSGTRSFTPEEEEEFGQMARSEDFYDRFAASIAPSIFGNTGAPPGFPRALNNLTMPQTSKRR